MYIMLCCVINACICLSLAVLKDLALQHNNGQTEHALKIIHIMYMMVS